MSKAKVMVVDDSPTELKLISKSLLAVGYDVITASDGEEALQKVHSESVTVVVLDVIMPKLNGFQVCRKIKSSPKLSGIKIILLTSKNQASDKFWGEKQGADVYMTKPFSDDELLANVAKLS